MAVNRLYPDEGAAATTAAAGESGSSVRASQSETEVKAKSNARTAGYATAAGTAIGLPIYFFECNCIWQVAATVGFGVPVLGIAFLAAVPLVASIGAANVTYHISGGETNACCGSSREVTSKVE